MSLLVGLTYALVMCALLGIVGHTPVDAGGGWDGQVYLRYVEQLGQGQSISGDPYRSIRLSGFLPLIGASALGASMTTLVALQTFLNILLLSASAALLHDTLRHLGVLRQDALLTLATGLLAWPLLIMPFFYPVLSDNIALAISCLSLWCWARGHQRSLYLLLAYAVWVLPGLFLVPLVLAAMPRHANSSGSPQYHAKLPWLLFMTSGAVCLPVFVHLTGALGDADIASHGAHLQGQTALISLRPLSSLALAASIAVVLWLGANAAANSEVWRSVRPVPALAAGLVLGASALAMYLLFDWESGFKGPPLAHFMLMQSLAAPFKPLVAHFLSFGPVIVMAMTGGITWCRGKMPGLPKALLACLLCFMPLLLIGSESRQWIGVLPVAIVVAGLAPFSRLQRRCCLLFAALLAAPSLWLNGPIERALEQGLSFQSRDWQLYFGRNGPWMSTEVYELGAAVLGVFVLVMITIRLHDARRDSTLGVRDQA
ncbi:hypothetical protein ACX3YG_24980 [Pseudomonas wadenswilerensis]